MPARPARLDELADRLRSATIREVVIPTCCFKTCERPATVFVSLKYKDGHGELYGLCRRDLQAFLEEHGWAFVGEQEQAIFVF